MKRGSAKVFIECVLAIAAATGCYAENTSNSSPLAEALDPQSSLSQLNATISTGPFARLYSDTYYNLIGRIEEDGFLRESNDALKGYDGMYPRTVGGVASLLLAVDRPEPVEKLLRCVLAAMKSDGMDRIPHAFDKKRSTNPSDPERYVILGRGDQLDGQAHVIMAWARLANYRGRTAFEDSTYSTFAALLNSSIRPPYCRDTANGKIPELMFNPYFEHSRTGNPHWRYDLLTQFFVGAALAEMIPIAERRNDQADARGWMECLKILEDAIREHFIVRRDGKEVFAELLLADSNKAYEGMGWVNLAPVAAQWNPFGNEVMENTIQYMRDHLMRERDGHRWLPTDSWPGNGFSPQIIGKGVGWELEFASREKDWKTVSEIVDLVEYLHQSSRIYMENAFLRTGNGKALPIQYSDSGSAYRNSFWALADPGNGEQASWWCWAVANLRKRLGLNPVPEPVTPEPCLDTSRSTDSRVFFVEEPGTAFYYTLDGMVPSERSRRYSAGVPIDRPVRVNAIAQRNGMLGSAVVGLDLLVPGNGLVYTFSVYGDDVPGACIPPVVLKTGVLKKISFPPLPVQRTHNRVKCEGFISLPRAAAYAFNLRSSEVARLVVDGSEVAVSSGPSNVRSIKLGKGFHPFKYEAENIRESSRIDISYSVDGKGSVSLLPELLYQKKLAGMFVQMPGILPEGTEFEEGDTLAVSITCPSQQTRIRYTVNGANVSESSPVYTGPFRVTKTVTVKAIAWGGAGRQSAQAISRYEMVPRKTRVTVNPEPNPRYAGHGPGTLIDGIRGTMDLSENRWLGFQGTDVEFLLDFGKSKRVEEVTVGCLHSPDAWIFLPKRLHVSISADGNNFKEVSVVDVTPSAMEKAEIRSVVALKSPVDCRFINIRSESSGILPPWHKAAGRDSWMFIDEIEVP
jgi:hypothetical protein